MEQKLFREELWESPKGILQLQVPPPHSSLLLIRSQGVYIIKIEAVGKEQEEKRGKELEVYGARCPRELYAVIKVDRMR